MQEEKNKSKLSQWLEILQQESWQLELVISGFAIFLLASLYDSLDKFMNTAQVVGASMMMHF